MKTEGVAPEHPPLLCPCPGPRRSPARAQCAQRRPAGSPARCQRPRSGVSGRLRRDKVPSPAGRTGCKTSARQLACVAGTDATGRHRAELRLAAGPAAVGRAESTWWLRAMATAEAPGGLRGPDCACARGTAGRCPHCLRLRADHAGRLLGGGSWAGPGRGWLWAAGRQRAGQPSADSHGGGALGMGGDAARVVSAPRPEPGACGHGIWLYVPSCPTSREDESSPRMVQRI
ncbi:pterin-4-alpha-carbinolamine dehydratase 2 isoform X2 [Callithrix jacchus]|uniref:pterin-4-alpha-carbinolamine dehydratase 2 isoform X1 n=1 Tax=Callithrix jacchus TaxID=9483 RepID=UPI0023DD4ECD|nr:pterin-4-alpha-carbinolamine dehydratase 2 isoform X1 [Callithrix jacchus]